MKPYIDIAFVVPLTDEFQRLQSIFGSKSEHTDGALFIIELDVSVAEIRAVAVLQDDMGKAAAARATDALLTKYDIGILIVIGIAGALSNDVTVGDVCFTGTVIDVLENAKVQDRGRGRSVEEFNSKFHNTDPLLTFALKYIQLGSDTKPLFEDWQLVTGPH